ncbi:hypothetical protein Nepgr_030001 [Nepenthes gracilis]|uniref:BHLH domain-containing protein n=1 Tax=Nepenthes gracilis TaxID=150966 RepID=A0AAD3TDN2_NEPGR|nr:hypothetical protein Nepgr_030001 [Nepenthes gracilis]
MFPLNQSGDLSFQLPDAGERKQQQDLVILEDIAQVGGIILSKNTGKGFGGCGGSKSSGDYRNNHGDNNKKKMIHRDIERQRRQEMANLFSSLRSVLPLEYIKGKRSMCDNISSAVNYVNHLQSSIKVLEDKRDELRSSRAHEEEGSSDSVSIHPCRGGLEIEISAGCREDGFALSRVLKAIDGGGAVHVVSCVSHKVNHRLFHKIRCEVNDMECIDLAQLQRRLTELVCPNAL